MTARSSNVAVVLDGEVYGLTMDGTGKLRFKPVADANGAATITVTVRDNGGTANGGVDEVSINFTVTVRPVNDAPTLDAISGVSLQLNSGFRLVTLTGISAGPANENGQTLDWVVTARDPGLVTNPVVTFNAGASSATIVFEAMTGAHGTTTIAVMLQDDGGTTEGGGDIVVREFTVTVTPAGLVVRWDPPPDIVYGTPLGVSQLNATANVPGRMEYSVVAGTILNAGFGQPLTATFTADDLVAYATPVSVTVVINVWKAPLTIAADDKRIPLGATLPALTWSYAGFVHGDTAAGVGLSVTASTTATASSQGGMHQISVTGDLYQDDGSAAINGFVVPIAERIGPAKIGVGTGIGNDFLEFTKPMQQAGSLTKRHGLVGGELSLTSDTATLFPKATLFGGTITNGGTAGPGFRARFVAAEDRWIFEATQLTLTVNEVLRVTAPNAKFFYSACGSNGQTLAILPNMTVTLLALNDLTVTGSNLTLQPDGFSLSRAETQGVSFALGDFLAVTNAKVTLGDLTWTAGNSPTGTIGFQADDAALFSGTGFAGELTDGDDAGSAAVEGAFNLDQKEYTLAVDQFDLSVSKVLHVTTSGLTLQYRVEGPEDQTLLNIQNARVQFPLLLDGQGHESAITVGTLTLRRNGFELSSLTATMPDVTLDVFLRLGTPLVTLQAINYTVGTAATGTITLTSTAATLFPGKSFAAELTDGSDADTAAVTGGLDLATRTLSLGVDQLDLAATGVLNARSANLSVSYALDGPADQTLVRVGSLTVNVVAWGNASLQVNGLEVRKNGFALADAVATRSQVTIGGFLAMTEVELRSSNINYSADASGIESATGTIGVMASGAVLFPGSGFQAVISDGNDAGNIALSGTVDLAARRFELDADQTVLTVDGALSVAAPGVNLGYTVNGPADEELARVPSLTVRLLALEGAPITVQELRIRRNGFSLTNAAADLSDVTIGGFLRLTTPHLALANLDYTVGGPVTGSLMITTNAAELFPNQSNTPVVLSDSTVDPDPYVITGQFDFGSKAFKLTVDTVEIAAQDTIFIRVQGATLGYALDGDDSQVILSADAAGVVLAQWQVEGTARGLQITKGGQFSVVSLTLNSEGWAKTLGIGGLLPFDLTTVEVKFLGDTNGNGRRDPGEAFRLDAFDLRVAGHFDFAKMSELPFTPIIRIGAQGQQRTFDEPGDTFEFTVTVVAGTLRPKDVGPIELGVADLRVGETVVLTGAIVLGGYQNGRWVSSYGGYLTLETSGALGNLSGGRSVTIAGRFNGDTGDLDLVAAFPVSFTLQNRIVVTNAHLELELGLGFGAASSIALRHLTLISVSFERLEIDLGNYLKLSATNTTLNFQPGPDQNIAKFESLTARLPSLGITGTARNFAIGNDGGLKALPGFSVGFEVEPSQTPSLKLPGWLRLRIPHLAIAWPDFNSNPDRFFAVLSAAVEALENLPLTVEGSITGAVIDIDLLKQGRLQFKQGAGDWFLMEGIFAMELGLDSGLSVVAQGKLHLRAAGVTLLQFDFTGFLQISPRGVAALIDLRLVADLPAAFSASLEFDGQGRLMLNTTGQTVAYILPASVATVPGGGTNRNITVPGGPPGRANQPYLLIFAQASLQLLSLRIQGSFYLQVSPTVLRMEVAGQMDVKVGGTTFFSFGVVGGFQIDNKGVAAALAISLRSGLPESLGVSLSVSYRLEINTINEVVQLPHLTLPAGPYARIRADGTLSVVGLRLDGYFEITVGTNMLNVQASATLDLRVARVSLAKFDVRGGFQLDEHGFAGAVQLGVNVDFAGFLRFNFELTYLVEVNNTGQAREFPGIGITLEAGRYWRIVAFGRLDILGLQTAAAAFADPAVGRAALLEQLANRVSPLQLPNPIPNDASGEPIYLAQLDLTDEVTLTGLISAAVRQAGQPLSASQAGAISRIVSSLNQRVPAGGTGDWITAAASLKKVSQIEAAAAVAAIRSGTSDPNGIATGFLRNLPSYMQGTRLPPYVSRVEDQTMTAGGVNVGFVTENPNLVAGTLVVTADADDATLLPAGALVLTSGAAGWTLALTPPRGLSGDATVTIRATVTFSDGTSLASTEQFQLKVAAVNQAPTVTGLADQTIAENGSTGVLTFTVGDSETSASGLTVTGSSNNALLVPAGGLALGGNGATRTLLVTPTSGQSGVVAIAVKVSDGVAETVSTFLVTILARNDAPTLALIPNPKFVDPASPPGPLELAVLENSRNDALTLVIGDRESASDTLMIHFSSDNPRLLTAGSFVLSGSGAQRLLTLVPIGSQSGRARVMVAVSDGISTTTRNFDLVVTPVNLPPVISLVDPLTTGEATQLMVTVTVDDDHTTPGDLVLAAVSSDNDLAPPSGLVWSGSGSARTLTLTPAAGRFGKAAITLTVSDGELMNSETFSLTVPPANTAPAITDIGGQQISQNGSSGMLAFAVNDREQDSSSLRVNATSSNPKLLPLQSLSLAGLGADRMLRISPAAGEVGSALVTLTVSDGELARTTSFRVDVVPRTLTAVGWSSVATHQGVGEMGLDIPADGSFSEPRVGGISRLIIRFSTAIDAASFTPDEIVVTGLAAVNNQPVDLSGISWTTSLREENQVGVITFSQKLPDRTRYRITLGRVSTPEGEVLSGDNDRVLTALTGDVNGDLRVDNADVGAVEI